MIRSLTRGMFAIVMIALVASVAMGEDGDKPKRKKKKQQKSPAVQMADRKIAQFAKKTELTDEQKTKIKEIAVAEAESIKTATDAVSAILTDEQTEARKGAWKQANTDGLKGEKRAAFVLEKLALTDEQKEKMTEAEASLKKVQKTVTQKMLAVLTDEQKAAVTPKRGNRKKKEAAAAG